MNITLKGETIEVPGTQFKVGDKAAAFSLKDLNDQTHTLEGFAGKPTILSIVPDINTRICAIQTKHFNVEASSISEINFATISNNTKEEQAAWCGQEGVDMIMLHDPENTFGESYSLVIPAMGRYARAIYVLDKDGVIQYEEIVPEVAQEPDYAKAIEAAKALV